jgi:hypothetical protein
MRSVSRVTGVSINTVSKLLIDAGLVCAAKARASPPFLVGGGGAVPGLPLD